MSLPGWTRRAVSQLDILRNVPSTMQAVVRYWRSAGGGCDWAAVWGQSSFSPWLTLSVLGRSDRQPYPPGPLQPEDEDEEGDERWRFAILVPYGREQPGEQKGASA